MDAPHQDLSFMLASSRTVKSESICPIVDRFLLMEPRNSLAKSSIAEKCAFEFEPVMQTYACVDRVAG